MELQSQEIAKIAEALAKAQGEIPVAVYDSTNPHFKNKYASYGALRKACQIPLSKNGISINHFLSVVDSKRVMITQLSHSSGQWMRSFLSLPTERETPQGIGSCLTYSKRYSLMCLLGLASDEDDDGEEAERPYRALPQNTNQKEASFVVPSISSEQAQEIENNIHPADQQAREDLLKYYTKVLNRQELMKDFFSLPISHYEQCLGAVMRRRKLFDSKPKQEENEAPF